MKRKKNSNGLGLTIIILSVAFLLIGVVLHGNRGNLQAMVRPDDALPTVPGAPTGILAFSGHENISIGWIPPMDDGGFDITSYCVFMNGTLEMMVVNATSCTVVGLTTGDYYNIEIAAVNAVGIGTNSTAIEVKCA